MLNHHYSGLLKQHSSTFELIQKSLDITVIVLTMLFALGLREVVLNAQYALLTVLATLIFVMLAAVKGLYRSWRTESLAAEIIDVFGVWFITVFALVVIGFASKTSADFSRVAMSSWFVLVPFGLSALRLVYRKLLSFIRIDGRNSRTVVFFGCGMPHRR